MACFEANVTSHFFLPTTLDIRLGSPVDFYMIVVQPSYLCIRLQATSCASSTVAIQHVPVMFKLHHSWLSELVLLLLALDCVDCILGLKNNFDKRVGPNRIVGCWGAGDGPSHTTCSRTSEFFIVQPQNQIPWAFCMLLFLLGSCLSRKKLPPTSRQTRNWTR